MSNDSRPKRPLVIAHRTTMGHAPENTLAGVRRAAELGCDGVEIDVRLCADGVPVLIHDDLLDRTTDATGRIADTTLQQLESIDAGGGERIPTLRQALAEIDAGMLLMIELKVTPGDDIAALVQAVLDDVADADALSWVWFWSFDSDTVIELAERAPAGRRIAHLCLAPTPDIWQVVAEHQLDGVSMHLMGLNEENVAACRSHDLAAFVWTVNEPDDIARCAALNPTGIVGDVPERIQAALTDGGAA